jgi:RNA polymerase sigma-70 factor (ECF subfamily)
MMIDKEIIENCKNGKLNDFRKLIEQVTPYVFSVAFRITGDEEQSKDIVQDSMITIWKAIKKIESAGSFNTWLYRIVVNKCYDHLRRKKRNPESRADENTWALISNRISENPSSALENSEISGIIGLLTERLSPKQKAVFVLSEIEDMSNEEIAEILGISRINVKANLHYARKKIGEMIEKYL